MARIDELRVGQRTRLTRTVSDRDVTLFAGSPATRILFTSMTRRRGCLRSASPVGFNQQRWRGDRDREEWLMINSAKGSVLRATLDFVDREAGINALGAVLNRLPPGAVLSQRRDGGSRT
jgi:hypothetical protein